MIAISLHPSRRQIHNTVSFSSTLYLRPVLDLLLVEVLPLWRYELRLGLQEALVNAARHGNCLDPCKQVTVHFTVNTQQYVWTITDEGGGFAAGNCREATTSGSGPCMESECGRGLYILRQIFDEVHWQPPGNQIRLCKNIRRERPILL